MAKIIGFNYMPNGMQKRSNVDPNVTRCKEKSDGITSKLVVAFA